MVCAFISIHTFLSLQITLVRGKKLKEIDQEPLKELHENELKNDTETLGTGSEEDHLESQEFTSNN